MSWLRHLCEIFRFWSKNRHFWALFVFCRFFKIFEKSRFWRFGEGSTSAVWSPFELKIFWGLCLALKSSHINFQLQRTAHGGGGASAKSLIWSSKGTTCDFWPFPKKAFLGTFGCSRVLNLLIHIFLSKTDILNAIRRFDFRTFWEIFRMAPKSGQKWLISAQGKKSSKVPILGRKSWSFKQIAQKTQKWIKWAD